MPYDLTTKDGITIRNIPDDVDPNSPELKARVASVRTGSTQSGTPSSPASTQVNNQPQWRDTNYGFRVRDVVTPDTGKATVQREDGALWYGPEQGNKGQAGWFQSNGMRAGATTETSAAGLSGGVVRGAGPYAAGAALGAAVGAPFAGVGAVPGAALGVGMVGFNKMVGDPLTVGLNHLLGTNAMTPSEAMNRAMDYLGVVPATTPPERIVQAGAEAAGNGLGTASLGQQLAKFESPTVRGVGNVLAQNPAQQVVGGAGAGMSSQTAAEMGYGPTGQTVAGIGGGLLTGSLAQPRTLGNAPSLKADVANAENLGIKPMTSDVLPPQTFSSKWLQTAGEKIPFVGTGGPRRLQQAQRISAVKDLLTEYGAGDLAQASDNVMGDLLSKRGADLEKYTGMKTGVVSKLSQAGPVSVDRTVAEIDNQIGKLKSLNTDAVQPVINRLEDFRKAIQGQDLGNIETLRKQLGKAFQSEDLTAVRGDAEKALTAIYRPLKEDIGNYIQANAGTPDYNKWMVANRRLSQMAGELKNDTLRGVLQRGEQTPEVVQKMLFSAKPSDAAALYSGLTPQGQANARAALLTKAVEKAGGVENLSPVKFVSEVKRLGAPMGVFFKGADEQRLNGLSRALDLTRRASVASNVPQNGMQAVPILAADLLSKTLGGPMGATAGAATVGGLARLYESAPVRNLLMKLPTVTPGSAEEGAIFKRLLAMPQATPTTEGEQ